MDGGIVLISELIVHNSAIDVQLAGATRSIIDDIRREVSSSDWYKLGSIEKKRALTKFLGILEVDFGFWSTMPVYGNVTLKRWGEDVVFRSTAMTGKVFVEVLVSKLRRVWDEAEQEIFDGERCHKGVRQYNGD